MAVKDRGNGKYDVELRGKHVKRVYDEDVGKMLEQSGKRLMALGKPLPDVILELRGGPVEEPVPKFGPYAEAWLDRQGIDESSRPAYRNNIARVRSIHSLPVTEVDTAALKSLTVELKRKGYAAETVKRTISTTKSILNDACDEGLVSKRPARKIKGMPRRKQVRPGYAIPRDRHLAIVGGLQSVRARPMFAVWPWLGLRLGEMIALEWDDIDLVTAKLQVMRQKRIDGSITLPKGEKTRTVDICDPALRELSLWLDTGKAHPTDLVFPGYSEGHLARSTVQKWCREGGKAAGIKGFHAHLFRHTFGSWLIQAGAPLTYIAAQMGDTLESVTRIYLHDLEEADKRGIMAFNQWASGDGEGTVE